MKCRLCLRFFLAIHVLTALGVFAQSPVTNAVTKPEILAASSPYGEATAMRNIPYTDHPTSRQNFDLYLPGNHSQRPFPLVVWIHGGAWMMGIKDWDNAKYLVRHGYAIASIDYRLSTEARFPAQIQDCNAALNFILSHAADYGVDPKRFVIGGASAGGHLALLLGMARHETDFGANPDIKPLAVLDFFGPTDFGGMKADLEAIHSEKGLELLQDAAAKLFGAPLADSTAEAKAASPINYVDANDPPVLILQGGRDNLVPPTQSYRLHKLLDTAGIKNQLIMVETAGHDGPLFSTPQIEAQVTHFLQGVLNTKQPVSE